METIGIVQAFLHVHLCLEQMLPLLRTAVGSCLLPNVTNVTQLFDMITDLWLTELFFFHGNHSSSLKWWTQLATVWTSHLQRLAKDCMS